MVLTPQESQYNPIGSVHGGIIATVLDSVIGCAVHTKLPVGRAHTTLEIKVNYLRGVNRETGPMTAVGRVIRLGRQTEMAEASLSDAGGKLFAQASTTCLIFDVPGIDPMLASWRRSPRPKANPGHRCKFAVGGRGNRAGHCPRPHVGHTIGYSGGEARSPVRP
jgi:uncharacterized protein (TIGR00369 family)